MKTTSHIDVYQLVSDLIIEKLEQDIIPLKQLWNDSSSYIKRWLNKLRNDKEYIVEA